jgi:hypothetical protein
VTLVKTNIYIYILHHYLRFYTLFSFVILHIGWKSSVFLSVLWYQHLRHIVIDQHKACWNFSGTLFSMIIIAFGS